MIGLVALGLLAVVGIIATIREIVRDGYRRIATRGSLIAEPERPPR